jgi:hypothetical protein
MSELNKAVADLLTKATQAAETAGQFALEQLPDIARQYVLYVGISSTFWVFVSVCVFFSPLLVYKICYHWNNKRLDENVFGPSALALLFSQMVFWLMMPNHLEKALLAFFAPKILLIQWAAELVK